jgi:hypothetical protein
MPDDLPEGHVLRVNDGNDSNVGRQLVLNMTEQYRGRRFFNTSFPKAFDEPWVLTVNPAEMTDHDIHRLQKEATEHLMFVRFRANLWNLNLADRCVAHYSLMGVPIVLTFMAYYSNIVPNEFAEHYEYRKRTLNCYWVLNREAWKRVMDRYADNPLVYSCSGDGSLNCLGCGICLREFQRARR